MRGVPTELNGIRTENSQKCRTYLRQGETSPESSIIRGGLGFSYNSVWPSLSPHSSPLTSFDENKCRWLKCYAKTQNQLFWGGYLRLGLWINILCNYLRLSQHFLRYDLIFTGLVVGPQSVSFTNKSPSLCAALFALSQTARPIESANRQHSTVTA